MRYLVSVLSLCVLSACATGAPYKKMTLDPMSLNRGLGYEDVKVSEGVFRVKFQGNGYDSSTGVYQHFLRRCAEITVENGYETFVVVDGKADNRVFGNMLATIGVPYYEGTIHLSKGRKPAGSMEAKEILNNLTAGNK